MFDIAHYLSPTRKKGGEFDETDWGTMSKIFTD